MCLRLVVALVVLLGVSRGFAVDVQVVIGGLDNPCAVAVQPETGNVLVSESGAGRVIRVINGKIEEVVTGFPVENYGNGPTYKIGPLGLTFIDKDTLAVGEGGLQDGDEQVRIYALPTSELPVTAYDNAKVKLGPLSLGSPGKGEGNFYGMAVTKTALFVTCNGDDSKGWIARADINGTKFGELRRFIATKEAVDVDAPVALTVGPNSELVVGQMGELDVPHDSLLSFYHSGTGKLLLNQKPGLHDITGVAYSLKKQLYAIDFAWSQPADGGLFQLVAENNGGRLTTKAQKIVSLEKPTAMAFGKDGELYITVLGKKSDDGSSSGQLLKIAPGL